MLSEFTVPDFSRTRKRQEFCRSEWNLKPGRRAGRRVRKAKDESAPFVLRTNPDFALEKRPRRLYNIIPMNRQDDRELVEKCIGGDPDAWGEFVDRFSGLIYWSIKRKLSKYYSSYLMSEADDIYQGVFTFIWEKKRLSEIRNRDNIAPWLIILASNATIDFIRKKNRMENAFRRAAEEGLISQGRSKNLSAEKMSLLEDALRILNKKEKAYLRLNYISGKRHKEIAENFNTSINSVSTVIARAKNKIKRYIESKNL